MDITKSCQYCGEVLFNLVPKLGECQVKCPSCGSMVGNVYLDSYTTVTSTCSKCNSKKFKVKVRREESNEQWIIECAQCKSNPESNYVDKDLNIIDEKSREILILKDTVDDLKNRIRELEYQLYAPEDMIDSIEYTDESEEDEIKDVG